MNRNSDPLFHLRDERRSRGNPQSRPTAVREVTFIPYRIPYQSDQWSTQSQAGSSRSEWQSEDGDRLDRQSMWWQDYDEGDDRCNAYYSGNPQSRTLARVRSHEQGVDIARQSRSHWQSEHADAWDYNSGSVTIDAHYGAARNQYSDTEWRNWWYDTAERGWQENWEDRTNALWERNRRWEENWSSWRRNSTANPQEEGSEAQSHAANATAREAERRPSSDMRRVTFSEQDQTAAYTEGETAVAAQPLPHEVPPLPAQPLPQEVPPPPAQPLPLQVPPPPKRPPVKTRELVVWKGVEICPDPQMNVYQAGVQYTLEFFKNYHLQDGFDYSGPAKQHNEALKFIRFKAVKDGLDFVVCPNEAPMLIAKCIHYDKSPAFKFDETVMTPWRWQEMLAQLDDESLRHVIFGSHRAAVAEEQYIIQCSAQKTNAPDIKLARAFKDFEDQYPSGANLWHFVLTRDDFTKIAIHPNFRDTKVGSYEDLDRTALVRVDNEMPRKGIAESNGPRTFAYFKDKPYDKSLRLDTTGKTAPKAKAKAKTKAKAKAKRAQNYSLQHLMVDYGVSIPQEPTTIRLDQGIDASEESSAPCKCADCVNGVTPRKECNNEDDKYVIEVHRAHLEEPQWDPMRQPQRAPPEDCLDWTATADPNQPNW